MSCRRTDVLIQKMDFLTLVLHEQFLYFLLELFFSKRSPKLGCVLIHRRVLYTGKYGTLCVIHLFVPSF